MNVRAARSHDGYLTLRAALQGVDAAVMHEALEASEEFLASDVAANPGRSEGDVLEFISSTYGAPEDVADVYRLV